MGTDVTKERWVVIDDSIACEREYVRKADLGKEYWTRDWIAFNVGPRVAKRIVDVHNQALENANAKDQ